MDDVEQDDGLEWLALSARNPRRWTHVGRVNAGDVEPVRPVDHTGRLGAVLQEVVVGGLVDRVDLGTAEGESHDGPVAVLDVVNLRGQRGDDAKVMASTLHRPEEVRRGVDGSQATIGKHDVHRNELVRDESVVALKPAVSATQGGTHKTDTFTGTGDGLLACSPELVGDGLRHGTATESSGPIGVDDDAAQLLQVDLNAGVHLTQRGDRSMRAIVREEGHTMVVGIFHLANQLASPSHGRHFPGRRGGMRAGGFKVYRHRDIVLGARNDDDIGRRLIQSRPPHCRIIKRGGVRVVDLRTTRQLTLKLRVVGARSGQDVANPILTDRGVLAGCRQRPRGHSGDHTHLGRIHKGPEGCLDRQDRRKSKRDPDIPSLTTNPQRRTRICRSLADHVEMNALWPGEQVRGVTISSLIKVVPGLTRLAVPFTFLFGWASGGLTGLNHVYIILHTFRYGVRWRGAMRRQRLSDK